MKKKFVAVLLSMAMIGSLVSCGQKQAPAIEDDEDFTSIEEPEYADEKAENAEDSDADESAESEGESEEATGNADAATEETEAAEGEEDAEAVTTGGKPWIDSEIKENVTADTVTDPKDDFHLYANKEWILSSNIPDGYTSWSHYAECGLETKKKCIELLSDESMEGHDAELVQTYNKLILDWDTRNKVGVSEIQDLFDKALEAKSLADIEALITNEENIYDYYSFCDVGASTGLNDPETYIAIIDSASLLLMDSAEYTQRSDYGEMNYGYEKDLFAFIAEKLGMSAEDTAKCFDAAIDMEAKLAEKIYTTDEYYDEDIYEKINNEMSYDEAMALCKVFPLEQIVTNAGYKYDGIYLATNPDYFKHLDEVWTEENLEGIKSVILVNYVLDQTGYLDRETYEKSNELSEKYFGKNGMLPDEEMAFNKVSDFLTTPMQKVYIEKYSSPEDKKRMEDLCKEVIDTYRELLSENTWATDEVKEYAIKKLESITIHAAYPDKFRDTSDLDISGCSLSEANGKIAMWEIEYNKSLLGKKADKEMWAESMNLLECNAYYDPSDNTINMIIGMMGEPFYSSDMSIEELYASIGAFWVGHEVSHAFDSNGSQFDADGVYRDWWTDADKEEFDKRIKKMDDYLDGIIAFGDQHFKGANIDTEMAADMTGLQCALRMASKVEGFDYDKFFTKYAQMNASLGVYSSELSLLTQDTHPLNYSRTNVPVQQFEEFYETYDVKEGDNMYLAPEDRLIIW